MPSGHAQGDRQASIRGVTGTAFNVTGDWCALFTLRGIPATSGDFNGRMLAYINAKLVQNYSNLPQAMQALAVANGATNFSSMGTFTP